MKLHRVELWSVVSRYPDADNIYAQWEVKAEGIYVAGVYITGRDMSVNVDKRSVIVDNDVLHVKSEREDYYG